MTRQEATARHYKTKRASESWYVNMLGHKSYVGMTLSHYISAQAMAQKPVCIQVGWMSRMSHAFDLGCLIYFDHLST
jgi:hypothetical protein